MKGILIYPSDIIPNTIYLHDNLGRYDLLGQILVNLGHNIPIKTRTPQELNKTIPPFTVGLRQQTFNSAITLEILSNNKLKVSDQISEANRLLKPYGISLHTERDLERMLK